MKRVIIILAVMALLVVGLAAPAFAGGTAYCGSGGYGYTSGSGVEIRTHVFGNHEAESSGTVSHGFFTGNQGWSVSGSGTTNGWCVT